MTNKTSTAKKAATVTAPKGFDDLSAFGQLNVEALTQASELATKAVEGINEELTTYTKKSFEDGVAAVKDLASIKSPTELMEKQSAFVQTAFDGFIAQATKMNEIFMAATKEATAPINARVEATTETFKSYAV